MFRKYPVFFLFPVFVFLSLTASASSDERIQPTRAMESETRWAITTLNTRHYLRDSVTELDGNDMVVAVMRSFDANRMFFTQEDEADFIFRFSDSMERFLDRGNLYPAFEIFETLGKRAAARTDWVRERLEQPFDFSTEARFSPDRRKADWFADAEAADDLWDRRLRFEVLNEIISLTQRSDDEAPAVLADEEETLDEAALRRLAEDPEYLAGLLAEAKDIVIRRHERTLRFIRDRDPAELQEAFVNSMSQLFDPHSSFFSADTLDDFNTSVQNSFFGIGALLYDDDGYCTIKELIPGGPAEASGQLGPEDKIIAVAEGEKGEMVDVIDMRLRHIVNKIKGPQGTTVRLLIRPGTSVDPSARREVVLVRDEIRLTANLASARLYEVPHPSGEDRTFSLGVIVVPSFYGDIGGRGNSSSTSEDVRELIGKLQEHNVEGLVLDLRSNGGGLLSEAVRLAGLFIPSGPIVQVRNGFGMVDTLSDDGEEMAWHGPLTVLTSRFSASASEIVAGALRDHRRALIVGDSSTHGKGTVQQVFQTGGRPGFFGGTTTRPVAAKITINQFFLPGGDSTQLRGVPSDIVLPSANEFLPIGESDLNNAIPWKAIDPLDWEHRYPEGNIPPVISSELVAALTERTDRRLAALEEFSFLGEQIEWRRARREDRDLSLNLNERIEQRVRDEATRIRFEEGIERLRVGNYPSTRYILKVSEELEARSREARAENEETAVDENGEAVVAADEMAEEDKEFDIHLREALRILADWNELLETGVAERAEIVALTRKPDALAKP